MNQLQKFQHKNGLVPDGIIGKNTLGKMREVFGIRSNENLSHFVGQIIHETGNFQYEVENLNYSWKALRAVFGKYFPTDNIAKAYERNPQKIANKVYGNRTGNTLPNDGWTYRGRGAIQLTGKNNYRAFAEYKKDLEILFNPDVVAEKHFFDAALFYFDKNNIWASACTVDDASINKVTRTINGGTNGLQDRINQTKKIYSILNK